MRIYKMTATFGKLEHQTLELKPGMNIIEAPNEWGKSTWCAFLVTMLYGLDTRQKTTKNTLADKEKYAPWSGSPMAGRIDLHWNGRDITIERSSKGRTPLGIFRAYETESGLAVPELTAASCGQLLLGVEQSVFRRTGFIRQADLPVTQDDALRRRLNALVTTGDETGDSDTLAEELKDLKNKVRYNRSGLLPQAEIKRRELEDRLSELDALEQNCRSLKQRLGEVKTWRAALENHRDALRYAQAEADAARVAEARNLRDRAEETVTQLEQICMKQPDTEDVQRKIRAIQTWQEDILAYQEEETKLGTRPQPPVPPELFRGMTFEQAETMVEQDVKAYDLLSRKKTHLPFAILGCILLLLCVPGVVLKEYVLAAVLGLAGLILLILGFRKKQDRQRAMAQLEEKYGSFYPEAWQMLLRSYASEKKAYDQAELAYRVARGDLDIRKTFLQKQREALFGSQSPDKVLEIWQTMEKRWDSLEAARREYQRAQQYLQTLQAMAHTGITAPAAQDLLTYPAPETERLLAEANGELHQLQNRLSVLKDRMETMGDPGALQKQLESAEQRIGRLEETYAALTLALDTLAQARQELQRKFAPRIAGRAQELLAKMTAGRYDRLTLREDLSLLAAAEQEETLHELQWRSDGTMDQLYLALRLAVAEELIPDVPLVLDDAFVRFDDTRLQAALDILRETAETRQVILFTCQSREKELLK